VTTCFPKAPFTPTNGNPTAESKNIRKPDGPKAGLVHRRINHTAHVYAHGDIHTNSVEGLVLSSSAESAACTTRYLQTYLDEYSFRYNRRDQGNLILKSILSEVSKRAVD
jgi:hypothetical protein